MRTMNRLSIAAACFVALLSAACTPAQQVAAITIAAAALPCYQAVAAQTTTGSTQIKVLTGLNVAASDPACAALDAATQTLIASAINAKAPVVVAPVNAPSAPAPGVPVPAQMAPKA